MEGEDLCGQTFGLRSVPKIFNEGPATSIIYLGIEVDSVAGGLRLPREKLQREIVRWEGKRTCTKS